MPLDFSIIEKFITDYREALKDKLLLRHERYRILVMLRDKLQVLLENFEIFEAGITSVLLNKIEKATTYEELKICHNKAVDGIAEFFLDNPTITDVHDLFRINRDAITVRVLELVEEEMKADGFESPLTEYVWIGLGSEGRDEQTILTDQDNMIVYETGTGRYKSDLVEQYYEIFSNKVMDRLNDVGFEKCKGGVMPSNDKWRGSVQTWKKRLEDRITYENGAFEDLDIIILTDARPIKGSKKLLDKVMAPFFRLLGENKHVMKEFIRSAVLMPTAITFFGNFRVEKTGEYKDMFNIKLMGWAPLILSVRMLALSNSIYETNTLNRIRLMREQGIIKKEMEKNLIDAYLTFVNFRIMNQIEKHRNNNNSISDMNHIKPDMLGQKAQEEMRRAMKSVEALQKYIEEILLFGQPL
jgi:signal-transduction protein with cAMP-binding, CBS, and nucleotidyltransferase domain